MKKLLFFAFFTALNSNANTPKEYLKQQPTRLVCQTTITDKVYVELPNVDLAETKFNCSRSNFQNAKTKFNCSIKNTVKEESNKTILVGNSIYKIISYEFRGNQGSDTDISGELLAWGSLTAPLRILSIEAEEIETGTKLRFSVPGVKNEAIFITTNSLSVICKSR